MRMLEHLTKRTREVIGKLEHEGFTVVITKNAAHMHLRVERNGKAGTVIISKNTGDWRADRNTIKQAYLRTE